MVSVYKVLKENGIELVSIILEKNGYYDPKLKMMFVDESLNEEKQKEVILHELGHALNHEEFAALYNNPAFRSKMESEATYYMMEYLIKESDGHFDYSTVIENYKLGLGWESKIK